MRINKECLLHTLLGILVFKTENKKITFWASLPCHLRHKEYCRMLRTSSLTFSFPNMSMISFFFFFIQSPIFHPDSPDTPFIDLFQLCVVFQGYNTWSCLLNSLYRNTILWYKSRTKLSSSYILNAKQFGWYLDFNITLV